MTPERWQQVKKVFDGAIALPAEERQAFLQKHCQNDDGLNSEVCKLLFNAGQAAGFLEDDPFEPQAIASTPVFAAGDLVANRFKVTRPIGQGGMGEVYEAEDTALGETVALKTIRGEIASDAHALARFRREILLARKVTHPNVCRVFDLEQHFPDSGPPIAFLTMELLLGETLARRIKRAGSLPPGEAIVLACQMADGLQAAHERGIIHRDFKSGNVILETGPDGQLRAVVTDFGLARTAAPKARVTSITNPSQLIGTPDYMAPEQFEGGEASYGSDIYSLGVVLFEMVTGTLPFREQTPFASALRRFQGPPPTPRSVIPGLNPVWDSVINRCLQPDSTRRFASASEVAAALKRGRTGLRNFSISRRAAIASVAAVPVVALFPLVFRYYRRRADIPEGSTVLLMPVDNATGDPELDGVTQLLTSYLSQSAHFNVLDDRRIYEVLRQMAKPTDFRLDPQSAREVAWRAGCPLAIFGSLSPLGQGFALNFKIEKIAGEPTAPRHTWVQVFAAADKTKIGEAVRVGGEWIRTIAGEAASDVASRDKLPGDTTTSSWEALNLFAHAERLKAQDKPEQAITVLNEAVRSDTHFALAWARLGDLANSIGRDGDGFRYWRRALDEMPARGLTKREELRIRGMYASDAEDHAAAEQAFRAYEVLYPSDFLPTFYLSGTLAATGRYEEAIQKAREAEQKQPYAYFAPARLARLQIGMGKPDDAAPYIARLKALHRPDTAALLEGAVAFLKGNYSACEACFLKVARSADEAARSVGFSLQASLHAERGKYARAGSLLEDGIAFDLQRGRRSGRTSKLLALAYLHLRRNDRARCRSACLAAVEDETGHMPLTRAASLLAQSGHIEDAQRMENALPRGSSEPIEILAHQRISGEIALAKGERARAVEKFREAARVSPANVHREYLARGLAHSGDNAEAADLYGRIVDRPGEIWQEPELEFPGFWTDMLFQFAHTARILGKQEDARKSLVRYLALRQEADSSLSEVTLARQWLPTLN